MVDDKVQARAAGVLEGYLSAGILHMHVKNVARPFCDGRAPLCDRIQSFLDQNLDWVSRMVRKHGARDVYWHQVRRRRHTWRAWPNLFRKYLSTFSTLLRYYFSLVTSAGESSAAPVRNGDNFDAADVDSMR